MLKVMIEVTVESNDVHDANEVWDLVKDLPMTDGPIKMVAMPWHLIRKYDRDNLIYS